MCELTWEDVRDTMRGWKKKTIWWHIHRKGPRANTPTVIHSFPLGGGSEEGAGEVGKETPLIYTSPFYTSFLQMSVLSENGGFQEAGKGCGREKRCVETASPL